MPQTLLPTDESQIYDREPKDESRDFVDKMTSKFEKDDEARFAAEHPEEVEDTAVEDDDGAVDDTDDESGEDADEDTESDESDDAGQQSDEDDDTSDESDETEEDADDADEADGDDSDDVEDSAETEVGDDVEEVAEEDPASAEFRALAKRIGVDLNIDDVPKGPAREMVRQKIRQMDSGYNKAMQDLREYRTEQVKYAADEKFRKDNPALYIVEMLREGGAKLSDEVNARIEKLGDPDIAEALATVTKGKRTEAEKAILAERDAQEQAGRETYRVETLARRLANSAGLPWEFADRAVASEILLRNPGQGPMSSDEIADIIRVEAKNYNGHVRAHRREASKQVVKDRTRTRKAHSQPGSRTPVSSAAPKPGAPKRKKINYNNEDERRAPMMEFAKRKFKGVPDE